MEKYDSDFASKVMNLDLGTDEEKALSLARKYSREKEFQAAWEGHQTGGFYRRSGRSILSVLEEVCNQPPANYSNALYIENLPDAYKLHNVSVDGILQTHIWDKELLDQGKQHNQGTWVKLTDKVPSLRDYYATFASLYQHRNGDQKKIIEEIKQMFYNDFSDSNWVMTSTRISYATILGKDKLIHNYKSKREYGTKLFLRGKNMELASVKDDDQSEALFGANDAKEISAVFEWVTGLKPRLHRHGEKVPQSHEETIGVFTTGYYPKYFNIMVTIHAEAHSPEARGLAVQKQ